MIRTIKLGDYISVQGIFVRDLPGGRVVVRDGARIFAGLPIGRTKEQTATA